MLHLFTFLHYAEDDIISNRKIIPVRLFSVRFFCGLILLYTDKRSEYRQIVKNSTLMCVCIYIETYLYTTIVLYITRK